MVIMRRRKRMNTEVFQNNNNRSKCPLRVCVVLLEEVEDEEEEISRPVIHPSAPFLNFTSYTFQKRLSAPHSPHYLGERGGGGREGRQTENERENQNGEKRELERGKHKAFFFRHFLPRGDQWL